MHRALNVKRFHAVAIGESACAGAIPDNFITDAIDCRYHRPGPKHTLHTQEDYMQIRKLPLAAVAALATFSALPTLAQQKPVGLPGNYPSKPVRVVIGASAGGGTDILGRLVFKYMGENWNHPFIVENKVSLLGSAMALDEVSKAPGDGYTMNVVSGSTYIGAAVVHKVPKNLLKVLDPIAQFTSQPFMLVATKNLPVNSVPELIALAKKNPGKLNYASSGIGGSAHLASEYLKHEFKVDIQHIPYKGIGPGYIDLLAGRVDISFGTTVSSVPHVLKGNLKLLATTSPKRLASLPDVPALSEFAPGFEYVSFFGVVGPAGMPKPVVAALNKQINEVLGNAEVQKRLESDGSIIERNTPEYFQKTLEGFVTRIEKLVREANLDLSEAGG